MSHDIDILTPGDQGPGNNVRVPSKMSPLFHALMVWSRAEGQPVWEQITAPSVGLDEDAYVLGYFTQPYVRRS